MSPIFLLAAGCGTADSFAETSPSVELVAAAGRADGGNDDDDRRKCKNVVCVPLDQCHLAGMCNRRTGICSNPTKPNGSTCDDGNACTSGDVCQAGVCVGSGSCKAFTLVGAYFNGTQEAVDEISATTGAGVQKGLLGDLFTWTSQFSESLDGTTVLAIGRTSANVAKLYTLQLSSGALSSVPVSHDYILGGMLLSGSLIGAFWNGTAEEVDAVDPATGNGTVKGTLGDLFSWTGQMAIDAPHNVLYAHGTTSTGTGKLYRLDLATGATTSIAFDTAFYFGGLTSGGTLVGAKWNGSAEIVALIDPATGTATTIGTMGDLFSWTARLAYDSSSNIAHGIGANSSGASFLYNFDLSTGTSTQVTSKGNYILAKQ